MNNDIQDALKTLKAGGTILYPTDTVWGLGCDATNAEAVAKIFELKKRNEGVPLLILVDSLVMLDRFVQDAPEVAFDLLEMAEKPTTIIFEKAVFLPENVVAKDGSIGIRVTKEEFSKKLIQQFRKPIISTSANIHGEPTPQFFDEISDDIKENVDFVVKYRQEDITPKQASSLIKINNNGGIKIIRE